MTVHRLPAVRNGALGVPYPVPAGRASARRCATWRARRSSTRTARCTPRLSSRARSRAAPARRSSFTEHVGFVEYRAPRSTRSSAAWTAIGTRWSAALTRSSPTTPGCTTSSSAEAGARCASSATASTSTDSIRASCDERRARRGFGLPEEGARPLRRPRARRRTSTSCCARSATDTPSSRLGA